MSAKWIAQEPPQEVWDERYGKRWAVDIHDQSGHHVATVYGETAAVCAQRAARAERRAA